MIYDVITYNGEKELFEIRYNILKDYVDEFIVVEAPTTFSGKEKPLYFKDIIDKYKKVKYFIIDENYSEEEKALADSSPNTRGASHWKREFLQKESIKKALTHLKDDDIVFIGDCDEIWSPKFKIPQIHYAGYKSNLLFMNELGTESRCPVWKLKLRVYTYYLNNRSSEEFWGTIATEYKNIKDSCLNHLRSNMKHYTTEGYDGWHFTSMHHQLERKLTDSYTKESYATDEVMVNLQENIKQNRDFLGRDFTYKLDESDWPLWLKEHRQDYKKMLK